MQIIKATNDPYFKEKSLVLGNCYWVIEENDVFHYEFLVKKQEAQIISDTQDHLEEVVKAYHLTHPFIYTYYSKDHSFFMTFDEIKTFKLPISILQVSQIFLDEERLEALKPYHEDLDLYFPVQIIDEEYVLLNQHHELYLTFHDGIRMVDVYMDENKAVSKDYLYLAKEQNIKTINDMHIISHKEYEEIKKQLEKILT